MDYGDVFVVGSDGNLWYEHGPFGSVPPRREQVDGNVSTFRALLSGSNVLTFGSDGNLWLESGSFGTVPPRRAQVDAKLSF